LKLRARRRLEGQLTTRAERVGLRWIGLGLWLALLAGSALLARAVGPKASVLTYVTVAGLATAGVVGLVAYARFASAPPGLRTLRVLAILLPTLFIVSIEAILFVVEADELLTEVGEHVFGTAVLSLGAVPFSLWIFRIFSTLRDQLAQHAERLETLHAASLAVTADPATGRLHETIVRGARAIVPADRAVLLVAGRPGRQQMVVGDPPVPEPGHRELELLHTSDARSSSETLSSDEARFLVAHARGSGPGAHALLLERSSGPAFTAEETLILDMYAVAAAAGIENADRLEEAQHLATVEERERIARDLHDDLGQLLGFLTAKIQAAQELVATGRSAQAAEELSGLESAARTLSAQVREAILGLRTSVGPERPLGLALEEYTAEFGIQAGLRTTFEGPVTAGEILPSPARYQALRIAQEALSNVRRHARATSVAVALRQTDGVLEMEVRDDGIGFDPAAAAGSGGFGLKTMGERARALGGTFEVRSAPGEGTTVRATVPTRREG
jgi:signal transduction histidine kinase